MLHINTAFVQSPKPRGFLIPKCLEAPRKEACLVVLRLLHVDRNAQLAAARNRGCHQVKHLLQLRHPAQRQFRVTFKVG